VRNGNGRLRDAGMDDAVHVTEELLPVHRAAIDKVFTRWLRPRKGGTVYCALRGLAWFNPTGTQGAALGSNIAPFQGLVQENI
jgi:hypothetical protein